MAVELAMRGYLRTNAVGGHRDFGRFGREYGRDVACVVSAATDFEAGSHCRMGGMSSTQQPPVCLTLRHNLPHIQREL